MWGQNKTCRCVNPAHSAPCLHWGALEAGSGAVVSGSSGSASCFPIPAFPERSDAGYPSDWWSYSCCGDPLRKTQSDPKNKSWLSRTSIVCFIAAEAGIRSLPDHPPPPSSHDPSHISHIRFGHMPLWMKVIDVCLTVTMEGGKQGPSSVFKQQMGTEKRSNQQTEIQSKCET